MDYSEYRDNESVGGNRAAVLTALADRQQELERTIERLEKELEEAKDQLRLVSEEQIPGVLDNLNGTTTLPDGRKIRVKDNVRASIKKDNMTEGCKWLAGHGGAAIIKRKYEVEFAKNQEEKAAEFERELRALPSRPHFKRNEAVNHMTLTSWVKPRVEAGEELPFDLLGIRRFKSTKITD